MAKTGNSSGAAGSRGGGGGGVASGLQPGQSMEELADLQSLAGSKFVLPDGMGRFVTEQGYEDATNRYLAGGQFLPTTQGVLLASALHRENQISQGRTPTDMASLTTYFTGQVRAGKRSDAIVAELAREYAQFKGAKR